MKDARSFYPWTEWKRDPFNPVVKVTKCCLVENLLTDISDQTQVPLILKSAPWLVYSDGWIIHTCRAMNEFHNVWHPWTSPIRIERDPKGRACAPHLFRYADNKYYLFYDQEYNGRWGPSQRIVFTTSKTFPATFEENAEVVLDVGEDGDWDEARVTEPFVFKHEDTFYLFYMGDKWKFGASEQIGLATTSVNDFPYGWKKQGLVLPHNPDKTAWDSGLTADPSLIRVGDTFYMLYTGSHANEKWKLGIARSEDLIHWERPAQPCLFPVGGERGWESDRLVRGAIHTVGDQFYLIYSGRGREPAYHAGLARSKLKERSDFR